MRCSACDNPIDDLLAAWEAKDRATRGRKPIYCRDEGCRRARSATRQRKRRRSKRRGRPHPGAKRPEPEPVERPVVSSVGHRFTRQELDFISPERWQALLAEQHEVDELEAAYEARRRRQPELKEISYERCVSCGAEVWGHNAVKDLRAPGRYRCQRCAAKL